MVEGDVVSAWLNKMMIKAIILIISLAISFAALGWFANKMHNEKKMEELNETITDMRVKYESASNDSTTAEIK